MKLSRCHDSDDWGVIDYIFTQIDALWGPTHATGWQQFYNAKSIKFNSRWWCLKTNCVYVFKQSWGEDNNLIVFPPRLICKTISKLMSDRGKGKREISYSTVEINPILVKSEKGDKW